MSLSSPSSLPTPQHWQCRLGEIGALAAHEDDLFQSLHVIATTPLGSDPLRPLFGCDALNYLDWPLVRAAPHLVRELTLAWQRWEPRVRIDGIEFHYVGVGHVMARVAFHVVASGMALSTNLAMRAGAL